ncbi:MAG: TlyA family RNA methyltransferase [Caldicoprobacter oshimai]|uniref:23S rRNA (Cytidine1920-2'-O)/16S rRNA (Cytidine1409-2'-O)-methyltransferase n=1 Tax=Caldicoprobacter faecalis TaxID=937334 RepID=A0A1I5U8G4_9FIRM|nr:MAG: TlyA family rRNA (cytidine-2'-O)-methyltransferase [Caldicoprobacter oshimai]SFP91532.1 23S rRNA (cytidine1920-2'-O)/16S rRNA (cytidine1409-2'-O)-methyltransferase [Caldicoprobacter faecalis]
MSTSKERLDVLLVRKNLIESREKAKAAIMAGLVYVGGKKVDKPGTLVRVDEEVTIKGDPIPYVSRGGLKLERALKVFNVSVEGRVFIDVGASTGGFTHCLLLNGAKKVYAIDVGYGQLAWQLRQDQRVVVMERTNIRYVTPDMFDDPIQGATIDVSFISLKLVLPVVKELVSEGSDIIALIKPQFEAGREKVGKKGVVKDPRVHAEVLLGFIEMCRQLGVTLYDITYSPITGPEGNIEFLAHVCKDAASPVIYVTPQRAEQVVEEAHWELLHGQ